MKKTIRYVVQYYIWREVFEDIHQAKEFCIAHEIPNEYIYKEEVKYWVAVQHENLMRCPARKGQDYRNLDAAIRFAQRCVQREDTVWACVKDNYNKTVFMIQK